MDHLPKTASGSKYQVPYLVPAKYAEYSPRGVESFALMQVKSLQDYPATDPTAKTPKSFFKSFLAEPQAHKISRTEEDLLEATQTYLYFVFLVEVFNVGGVWIDAKRFVTPNEVGNPVVSTSALTEYICYWHLSVDNLDTASKQHHLNQLTLLFGVASAWLTAWSSRLQYIDPPPSDREGYTFRVFDCHHLSYPRAQMILLSIRVLQETLHTACESAYSSVIVVPQGMTTAAPEHSLFQSTFMQSNFDFVDQLMLDAGWCPNEIALLTHRSTSKQNALKYFLSSVDRKRLGRDHSRCNSQRCYKLMEYPYLPEHVQPDCQCRNVFTCKEERIGVDIVSIIQRGLIPLIRIRTNATDEELLELSAYDPNDDQLSRPIYIAVSHVWSDGRGNRAGNFLPACQIRELQSCVSFSHYAHNHTGPLNEEDLSHMENVYFWIDTLCIPRNHEPEKKRAIKSMSEIYQHASSVLVIDKGILRSDLKTSAQDILMVIAESNWAKRLWTLQEGRLASKLRFQFSNGVYGIDSRDELFDVRLPALFWPDMGSKMELASIMEEIDEGINGGLAAELLIALASVYENAAQLCRDLRGSSVRSAGEEQQASRLFKRLAMFWLKGSVLSHATNRFGGFLSASDIFDPGNSTQGQSLQLLDICDHLHLRRTTEPADEAGSIASLLNADVAKILNTDGKERMAVLLQNLESVPIVLLFFQGERYEEDGRRWVPKSFLLQNGRLGDMWGPLNLSSLIDQHAQPQPEGLMVSLPGFRLNSPPISPSPEQCYLSHGTSKYVLTLTEGNRLRLARTDWASYANRELAVILTTGLDDESMRAWSGILISRRREENSIYYSRFEHTVYMHRAEQALKFQYYSIQVDWPSLKGRETFVPIQVLPSTQAWCVG